MKLLIKLRALFQRRRLDADLTEELRLHLEQRTEENIAAGMAPDEARFAAQRAFGGVEQIKERCRDQRGWVWLETIGQDLRHGIRQLVRTPGFTALAVLSLAVGIGVNATIFSAMDAAFLRPLPVKDPETLVKFERPAFSWTEYQQVRDGLRSYAGLAAASRSNVLLQGAERTELVPARAVSGNYFTVLGVAPAFGRFFSERSPDLAEPIAVLSHALWVRRFGGDPGIVGQTITLNGRRVTVLGVAAQGFTGEQRLPPTELWYPVTSRADQLATKSRIVSVFGRLAPGTTPEQAQAEAATFLAAPEWAALGEFRDGRRVIVWTEEQSRMDHGGRLTYLMGPVVGLVLLVACANVSCLLLGRYEQRRREIAVRLALGASRTRVMRFLLAEGALLSLFGGACGLLLTAWGLRAVPALLPATLASWAPDPRIDARVVALTLGLVVLATLVFGLVPAWRAARCEVAGMLKADGVRLGKTPGRNVLVVAQVAVAMVFLTLAALFVRGFWVGTHRDFGFTERKIVFAYLVSGRMNGRELDALFDDVRQTVAGVPGVRAVSLATSALGSGRLLKVLAPQDEAGGELAARSLPGSLVDPGYFATLGIPLLHGRDFTRHDTRTGARVAVVSEAMARRFWPGEDPIGRMLLAGRTDLVPRTVVGVVRDVSDLSERDPATQPAFYLPLRQELSGDLVLVASSTSEPAALAAPIREALRRMDGSMTALQFDTLEGKLRLALFAQWIAAWLGGVLGLLAFTLAVSGLYGVVAYAVARRTRELGIRVALGAAPRDAVWLVLRQGLRLALIGAAVGLPLAIGAGLLMRGLLVGISPMDPVALAGAAAIVFGVAALASYLPARRAMNVDPMTALRVE